MDLPYRRDVVSRNSERSATSEAASTGQVPSADIPPASSQPAAHRLRRFQVSAATRMTVEADGEVLGVTPATFEVLPRVLSLSV